MNNRTITIFSILAVIALIAGVMVVADEKKSDKDDDGRFLYVCPDESMPCVSFESSGCTDCKSAVEKKPYDLHHFMESTADLVQMIKKNFRSPDKTKIRKAADMIKMLSDRISDFQPERNKDDVEDFKKYAEELGKHAEGIAKAAENKEDENMLMSYKKMTSTCSSCHNKYRKQN